MSSRERSEQLSDFRPQTAWITSVRHQIEALRISARFSHRKGREADHLSAYSDAVSNTNILLAAELSFKLFSIAYKDKAETGHSLKRLYSRLPDQIRRDLAECYLQNKFEGKMSATALILSSEQPEKPESAENIDSSSLESLLDGLDGKFEQSRYFFEGLSYEGYIFIYELFPTVDPLVASSLAVLDFYVQRGTWL